MFQKCLPCDASPADSRLLEVARKKLVMLAKCHGITLRQSYARQGPGLSRKARRYAHSRRFKRMQHVLRRQRPVLGRLLRYAAQAGPLRTLPLWLRDRLPGLTAAASRSCFTCRYGMR